MLGSELFVSAALWTVVAIVWVVVSVCTAGLVAAGIRLADRTQHDDVDDDGDDGSRRN